MADQAITAEKTTKDVVARHLAEKHYEYEEGLTHIYRLTRSVESEDLESEPIKLLEVNATVEPVGVKPLYFKPAPEQGVRFSVVIVEVTPTEFEQIRSEHLRLPKGWQVGEELPKTPLIEVGNV